MENRNQQKRKKKKEKSPRKNKRRKNLKMFLQVGPLFGLGFKVVWREIKMSGYKDGYELLKLNKKLSLKRKKNKPINASSHYVINIFMTKENSKNTKFIMEKNNFSANLKVVVKLS